jgi:hypothetical protein
MSDTADVTDPRWTPYLAELGRVAAVWSQLDWDINDFIWELANVSRAAGTAFTAQMIGPGPRFRCLISLLHLRKAPKEIIDDFNSISSKIE